ncbi:MAG TPA: hypothetical protein DCO79_04725 [Spirochaeta sp.]|nr:hypothetical protein [Spirochaeta sp.]
MSPFQIFRSYLIITHIYKIYMQNIDYGTRIYHSYHVYRVSKTALFLLILTQIILFQSCSLFMLDSNLSPEEYLPETVLIVADEAIYTDISARIDTYRNDISKDGITSAILLWDSADDCSDLKSILQSYHGKAESGFFIGGIPPAWYEQSAFGQTEVFPSDLYYMEMDFTIPTPSWKLIFTSPD